MRSKSRIAAHEIQLPAIHPGDILAGELAELDISVAAFARALDVPQSRMAEIVAGKRWVTADTALRLAGYFGTSARILLNLQAAYDLKVAEQRDGKRIAAAVRRLPH